MRIAYRMNSAFIDILHSVPIDFGIGVLFYSNKNERKVQKFPMTVFFFITARIPLADFTHMAHSDILYLLLHIFCCY